MEIFSVIYDNIIATFETMSDATYSGIIFGLLFGALVSFLFSTKNAKKGNFIKNWFLFYLSILFIILTVFFTYFVR